MAEAIGLVASCLSILKTIERVNGVARRNVRTNAAAKKELVPLLGKLTAYEGLIKAIKLEAEFDDSDQARLLALRYVDGPLRSAEVALEAISGRLDHLPKHVVLGKLLDGRTVRALKTLDESRQILQLALDADQRTITKSVEQYVINVAEDLRDFRAETGTYLQTLGDQLVTLNERTHAPTDSQLSAIEQADRQRIRQWLTPCDPSRIYEQSIQIPHLGSGQWFVDHQFRQWIADASCTDPRTSIMWLRGRSGFGKTVLTSIALKCAKTLASACGGFVLAFFYCSFTDKASQDPVNIIGSFIAQICDQVPQLWSIVANRHTNVLSDTQRHSEDPTLSEVVSLLEDCCRNTPSIVLVLDAPNESEQSAELMSALRTACTRKTGVRFFISSTEEVDVSILNIPGATPTCVDIDVEMINCDIGLFIDGELTNQPRLSKLPKSLKSQIKSKLLSQAQGSFRWAQCQLETLAEQARSPTSIQLALNTISPGLDKLYRDTLLAVPQSDLRYVQAALLWLTYAWRPLRLAELSEAMVLEDDAAVFDTQSRLLFPLDVLRPCRILVSFNASSGRVTLAHSSVEDYMISRHIPFNTESNPFPRYENPLHSLSRHCVRYLSLPAFQSGYCLTNKDKSRRKTDWPLFEFASRWPLYARAAFEHPESSESQTSETIWRFLKTSEKPRGGNFGAWIQLYIPSHLRMDRCFSPLYYAAREGLDDLVKLILNVEGKMNLEVPGGSRGSTPLHVASAYRHFEVVRTLLAAGANPLERNHYGERGIDYAAAGGDPRIVQALLDAGADEPRGFPFSRIGTAATSAMTTKHKMPPIPG